MERKDKDWGHRRIIIIQPGQVDDATKKGIGPTALTDVGFLSQSIALSSIGS
jgi:hypothetical protein